MSDTPNDGGPAFPSTKSVAAVCPDTGKVQETYIVPTGGMSLREYAAIHLRVPRSDCKWLDDMIREAQRNELAAKAMAAMVASYRNNMRGVDDAQTDADSDIITPARDMMIDFNAQTGQYEGASEIASDAYIIADAMLAAMNGGAK